MMEIQPASIQTAALAGMAFAARLAVPGAAWRWLLDGWPAGQQPSGRPPCLVRAGQSAALGLAFALITCVLLGSVSAFYPAFEWTLAASLSAAGFTLCRIVRGTGAIPPLARDCLGLWACLAIPGALAMLARPWSEWIAGGWDPGVYVNIGMRLAETGSFGPWRHAFLSGLSPLERLSFCRVFPGWAEVFPGFSLDPSSGNVSPMFFPGTPALVAMLHHLGGIQAALRVNAFAGIVSALALTGLARLVLGSNRAAMVALGALVLQPIWLYHLKIPISEMTGLALVCGMGLLIAADHRSIAGEVFAAALMMAAVLNRFSFLPFGCLAIAAACWLDAARGRFGIRTLAWRAFQAGVMAVGALWDIRLAPMTWPRLAYAIPSLIMAAAIIMTAAAGFGLLVISQKANPAASAPRLPFLAAFAVLILLAGGSSLLGGGLLADASWAWRTTLPFVGYGALCAAAAGLIAAACETRRKFLPLQTWLAFLAAAAAVTLYSPQIARLLPWALRRHLEFFAPLLALSCAFAFETVPALAASGKRKFAIGCAAIAAAAAFIAMQLPVCRQAWQTVDYPGALQAVAELAEKARGSDAVAVENPAWATPLHFIFGLDAVSVASLARNHPDSGAGRIVETLSRTAQRGRTTRLVTSGTNGVSELRIDSESLRTDWAGPARESRIVDHSPSASSFRTKPRTIAFQLHTLLPGTSAQPATAGPGGAEPREPPAHQPQ